MKSPLKTWFFSLPVAAGLLLAAGSHLPAQVVTAQQLPAGAVDGGAALSPYIDVHAHMDISDPQHSVDVALGIMSRANTAKVIFMPSPFSPDDKVKFEAEAFIPALKAHPDKFAWLAGGGTLNPMLQEAAKNGVTPEMEKQFRAQAEKLLAEGAVGFGEISAEHVPSATSPSYSSDPPDGRLFLDLDDIAARHNVPITLHMEAVPQDMPTPSDLKSPPMPRELKANIPALERLLDHNRRAKIVWAHAGSTDNYGTRTPDLCRRLLAAHTNLYMELKVDLAAPGKNPLIDASGNIKPEWVKLIKDYPGRFLVGTDQNYPPPQQSGPQRWQAMVSVLNQLPMDLRRKAGIDNPTRIYLSGHKPVISSQAY